MTRYEHAGAANYNATLNADITSGSNSLTLATGGGTGFPTGGTGKFWLVIDPGNSLEEKVLATARSGDSITGLTRAQDGTTAVSHTAGAKVYHIFSAFEADEANAHINTTTRDDHTQYTKIDGTRAFTGTTAIAAAPAASAVGDAQVAGTALTLARSDHKHAREAFATPVAIGTANAAGSATTIPHSDHVHAEYPVPMCRAYNSAAISTTTGTLTALTFDSERYDTDTMHSTVSNTGRLVATTAGKYHISATVEFPSNATGARALGIRANGSTYIAYIQIPAVSGTTTNLTVSGDYAFLANEYVEVVVQQTSTGNLNVNATGNLSPEVSMHRIGP